MTPLLFGNYQKILISFVAIFVLAAAGFAFWNSKQNVSGPTAADLLPPPATTSPSQLSRLESWEGKPSNGPPSYRGQPIEGLNADPKFLAQVPETTYQRSLEELIGLADRIKQNPRDYESWLRVAHIKHFYGDEIGARDAYEYMNLVFSEYPLPFYNLAVLYGYYLKEPAKAIPKYASAIERNPAEASYYIGFADFYREVLGDLKSAEAVLLDGEKKIQGNINILIALGALYKTKGDIVKSIGYYEKVLGFPSFQGQERSAVLSEVERLKRSIQP